MATLEKIRSKAGLLVLVVGLALFAFIIGDFLNSGSTYFKQTQERVAEVDGEAISIRDYQERIDEMVEMYKMQTGQTSLPDEYMAQIRQSVFDTMVQDIVLGEATEKVGMEVSADEARVIDIQYIVSDSEDEINKAYNLVNSGSSFFAVAKEYNADGEYEYELKRDEMDSAFEKAAKKSEKLKERNKQMEEYARTRTSSIKSASSYNNQDSSKGSDHSARTTSNKKYKEGSIASIAHMSTDKKKD